MRFPPLTDKLTSLASIDKMAETELFAFVQAMSDEAHEIRSMLEEVTPGSDNLIDKALETATSGDIGCDLFVVSADKMGEPTNAVFHQQKSYSIALYRSEYPVFTSMLTRSSPLMQLHSCEDAYTLIVLTPFKQNISKSKEEFVVKIGPNLKILQAIVKSYSDRSIKCTNLCRKAVDRYNILKKAKK